MQVMRILLLLSLGWVLTSCLRPRVSEEGRNRLMWTQWVLIELSGDSVPGTVQSNMHLSESGQVTGSGGMHRFLANFELGDNGAVSFSRPRTIQQVGPDWGWTQQERFLSTLERTSRWWFYGPHLVLADSWNQPHLVFLPAE